MNEYTNAMPFEGLTNEQLYADLRQLDPNSHEFNLKFQALSDRVRPITISVGAGFRQALSFTMDDVFQEGMLLIYDIIRKGLFTTDHIGRKGGSGQFHKYYSSAFRFRMAKIYRDCILREMVPVGTSVVGYAAHQPVFAETIAWCPAADEYRTKQRERNARWYDKKLAAQGKSRQPVLTEEERQARADASKQRAKDRALQWQRDNREAYNARRAEIRRQKKDGTFVDRRRKSAAVAAMA